MKKYRIITSILTAVSFLLLLAENVIPFMICAVSAFIFFLLFIEKYYEGRYESNVSYKHQKYLSFMNGLIFSYKFTKDEGLQPLIFELKNHGFSWGYITKLVENELIDIEIDRRKVRYYTKSPLSSRELSLSQALDLAKFYDKHGMKSVHKWHPTKVSDKFANYLKVRARQRKIFYSKIKKESPFNEGN